MTEGPTRDAVDAVLRVLRDSGTALSATEIKKALLASGRDKAATDALWESARRKLPGHREVAYDRATKTYGWVQPSALTAPEALDRILNGKLSPSERQALATIVRDALQLPSATAPPEATATGEGVTDGVTAARQRQAAIDAARTLAEVAIEVEELTAKQATPATLIHRLRARVHRSGLEPIDRAGEETTFDRKKHRSIGGSIRDGAPVFVVRPGYVWKAAEEDVLIAKAVVEE